MTDWIEKAKEIGFDCVGPLNPQKLEVNAEVRAMCSADKCHVYNKNWTCLPNCGMRGASGAIDHVRAEGETLSFSVIGNGEAKGICGSGLIDLIACMLAQGVINKRGRIQKNYEETEDGRCFRLTDSIVLTQDDVREVQMAKGAIAAGIYLMTEQYGISVSQIDEVLLAGAFGSYINPESACRIGLIPSESLPKIRAVGNAAGMGSCMMSINCGEFEQTQELIAKIEPLELASLPTFQKTFAKCMAFD